MVHAAQPLAIAPVERELDDGELVARARGGDRSAEEALYRRHGPRLLARTARLLGDPIEAEDVVQDVFITAFAQLARLREPNAFGGWVLRAAVRRVWRVSRWRAVRRRFRRDSANLAYLNVHPTVSPEEHVMLGELEGVLATLSTADRIAWSLHVVERLTLVEVSQACGCSLATAKRRIAAARLSISERIQGYAEVIDG